MLPRFALRLQAAHAAWADQHTIAPETARVTTNLGSHVIVHSGDSGGHCIRGKSWEPEDIGPNLQRSTSWQTQYNRPGYNEYALASCGCASSVATNATLNLTSERSCFHPMPCRFIIDCRHWRAHLPQTIEAFFFRAPFFTPEETKRMIDHMRDVNERFLSRFGLSSSAHPLLRFDPSQREPFSLA